VSVSCNQCGEELIGSVNRCWRCGTFFQHVDKDNTPPIRRAGILRDYFVESIVTADVVEENLPDPTAAPTTKEYAEPTHFNWMTLAQDDRLWGGIAIVVCLCGIVACYYSVLGIGVAILGMCLAVHRVSRRMSRLNTIGFVLGIGAMLFMFARMLGFIYAQTTGANLFTLLFGA